MVTEVDREAKLSKVIAELRALFAAASPGDLSTAERHIESETVECPACQGDGEIEAADYCNFDGRALGVQFYGIGREFASHEKLWTATIKALPTLLDAADPARHRTASTAALTAENQRLREELATAEERCIAASTGGRSLTGALSTPSEVSEPVADESGGETMDWSEAVDFVDRFDLPISMVPDLVSPPNPTNGDAVREALLGGCLGISGNTLTFDAGNRADVETVFEHLLATLAKHGGSEASEATNV